MKAILLAGGKGTRLWPLSRENYPKQFVEFIDAESLFQLTVKRLLKCFRAKDIITVTSLSYKFHALNQIDNLSGVNNQIKSQLKKNIIIEPYPKSTAPAVMLVIKSQVKFNEEVFFVFPSDHIIKPVSKFIKALKKAEQLANKGYMVVFGVKPTSASPGYGYVLKGERILKGYRISKFVEKPSKGKIKKLLEKKAYWNAGIFAFRGKVFLSELKEHSFDIFKYTLKSYPDLLSDFVKCPSRSIDYAIMQKTKQAALVEFDVKWSDLGSWESVMSYFSSGNTNFSIGDAEFFDSNGCFSFSKDKLISFLGVKDILAIESSDSILIMKKGHSDRVKELTQYLSKRKIPHTKESLTVYRPWGYYTVLKEKENYKVKEIGVYPKKFVSLQRHRFRSEHWNVVEGRAKIRLGNKEITVKENESVFVPKGIKHRIYNPSGRMLKIIEVQIGSYLGEDDIERFDTY